MFSSEVCPDWFMYTLARLSSLPTRASSLAFLVNCPQCMISVCPLTRVLELIAYILTSAAPQIKEHNLETLFPCLLHLGPSTSDPFTKAFGLWFWEFHLVTNIYPKFCKSENLILKGLDNSKKEDYCSLKIYIYFFVFLLLWSSTYCYLKILLL